jgi:hypothetical protein
MMLFANEWCHLITLVFLLPQFNLKFCFKNSPLQRTAYHLVRLVSLRKLSVPSIKQLRSLFVHRERHSGPAAEIDDDNLCSWLLCSQHHYTQSKIFINFCWKEGECCVYASVSNLDITSCVDEHCFWGEKEVDELSRHMNAGYDMPTLNPHHYIRPLHQIIPKKISQVVALTPQIGGLCGFRMRTFSDGG